MDGDDRPELRLIWDEAKAHIERSDYDKTIEIYRYLLIRYAEDNRAVEYANAYDKTKVKDSFNSSQALKIVHDLWNNDKHTDSSRNSKSGLWSRIEKIRSSLQLTTKAEKSSSVGLTSAPQEVPKVLGDGTAKVIIPGDILDRDGNNIGNLYKTVLEAVEAWESVLGDFGVKL